jgi:hypothetical protein
VLGMPPAFNLSQDQTLQLNLADPKALSFELKCLPQAFIADSWLTLTDGPINPPAGVRTNFLRTLSKIIPFRSFQTAGRFARGSRTSYSRFRFRQHLNRNFFLPGPRSAVPAAASSRAAHYTAVFRFVKGWVPTSLRTLRLGKVPHTTTSRISLCVPSPASPY